MSSDPQGPLGPEGVPDGSGGGLDTLTEEQVQPAVAEPGDHERFAHYVQKEKIMESAVTGTPVLALCGKVWVPNRDPQKFPVCPECQEIYESLPPNSGGDPGGDSSQ